LADVVHGHRQSFKSVGQRRLADVSTVGHGLGTGWARLIQRSWPAILQRPTRRRSCSPPVGRFQGRPVLSSCDRGGASWAVGSGSVRTTSVPFESGHIPLPRRRDCCSVGH
jgi:hypothetical protein